MNTSALIDQLEMNMEVFEGLLKLSDERLITWKQAPEKWSLVQIVCHLSDEEKEDFRERVKTTLETPGSEPPKIDPASWVNDRNYQEQDFDKKVDEFLTGRRKSIEYLREMENADWTNSFEHKIMGPLSAEFFLKNWVVHDLLHIKQITRLRYDFYEAIDDLPIDYAGKWT